MYRLRENINKTDYEDEEAEKERLTVYLYKHQKENLSKLPGSFSRSLRYILSEVLEEAATGDEK